jgi:hypothetical protein
MDFAINQFTTINGFKRTGVFTTHTKFGESYEYEGFEGTLNGDSIKGDICLADNHIYGLTLAR